MFCQNCQARPAQVKLTQTINGRRKEIRLCNSCAEDLQFKIGGSFPSLFSPSPFFESFFSSPREEMNIADYFSSRAHDALQKAAQIANEYNSSHIDTEHLLLGILESEDQVVSKIFEYLNLNIADLKNYTAENIQKYEKETEKTEIDLSPRTKHVLQNGFQQARSMGHNYVGPEHLLLGLIDEEEGIAHMILSKHGISTEKIRQIIVSKVKPTKEGKTAGTIPSNTPTLDKYSRDLTKSAKDGKLDPVIGRAKEVQRVIQILSRRTKNNPVLIGEPGVGKTAIVEGLAQRIVSGNTPETLKDKRVIALDLGSMIAGTKYRGEFEDRLKKSLQEIEKEKRGIVLFIDELHTVVGAGAVEGQMDASNMLKPALARGDLQTIGATTLEEYKKYIEKDAALERRFQPVLVSEPSIEEAIQILRGLKDKYEAHHKVEISDEAIVAAVTLSSKFLQDRFLPDKAIDLIDESAAKVHLEAISASEDLRKIEDEIKKLKKEEESEVSAQNFKKAAQIKKELKEKEIEEKEIEEKHKIRTGTAKSMVSAEDIKNLISSWTGIPLSKIGEEEMDKLINLEKFLAKRVIGQEKAIAAVSEAIRRGRAGLKDPKRPIGSFLFLGPTGVGKTELTKALTAELFEDQDAMIRLDMSEYMEKHSVSKLIGSPPGYIGYEEGGQLTEKIRRKAYSVILLDEIEKAHPDVFNILLQILEDGRLTDSKGKTVDFKNTVIIATSNVGSTMIQESSPDPEAKEVLRRKLLDELKKIFRPEFLNRLDEIIIFEGLTQEQVRKIVDLRLRETEELLKSQGIKLQISNKAKDKLAEDGFDPTLGARPIRREIQRQIENPISSAILKKEYKKGDTIKVGVKNDKLVFSK